MPSLYRGIIRKIKKIAPPPPGSLAAVGRCFKQNPGKVVEQAHGQPVAVLNHNRPAFYTVSPELMARMAELYDERELESLVRTRLKSLDQAVEVSLDDL